jgi:hypothetical protein
MLGLLQFEIQNRKSPSAITDAILNHFAFCVSQFFRLPNSITELKNNLYFARKQIKISMSALMTEFSSKHQKLLHFHKELAQSTLQLEWHHVKPR